MRGFEHGAVTEERVYGIRPITMEPLKKGAERRAVTEGLMGHVSELRIATTTRVF